MHTEPVAHQPVVNEVVTTLRPLAEAKGRTFELSMPARDVTARADRRALSQIHLNLTNNAIKPRKRGLVDVESCLQRKDGVWRPS